MSSKKNRPQILLTNDDGIKSPGLWAAAQALSKLGFVTIAAPREQSSATGRSLPITSDGQIHPTQLMIGDQEWTTYAVGGTPAQAVLHAVMEIMPEPPDLVVSGINYGENIGDSITISGTVGAALEGAALGIPAIAASLELDNEDYLGYSETVDFSTAAHFVQMFARLLLENRMPADVQVLKIDVPHNATPSTPWHITSLAKYRYYFPEVRRNGSLQENGYIGGKQRLQPDAVAPGTDVHVLAIDRAVSVTPLSLDMTSRVDLRLLEQDFKEKF